MVCADTWKPARVPGQGDRVLTIQHTDECPAHGFACEFEGTMEGPTTSIRQVDGKLVVCGVSHDNGKIVKTIVNGLQTTIVTNRTGVVDWRIELPFPTENPMRKHGQLNAPEFISGDCYHLSKGISDHGFEKAMDGPAAFQAVFPNGVGEAVP